MKRVRMRSYWRVLRLMALADWLFILASLGILAVISWASITLRPAEPENQHPAASHPAASGLK
jgi:hypothetical protein